MNIPVEKEGFNCKVGQRLQHKTTGRIVIVHKLNCNSDTVFAISSEVIHPEDYNDWQLIVDNTPVNLSLFKVETLLNDVIKPGMFLRLKPTGDRYIVQNIFANLIFVTDFVTLINPSEWVLLSSN